MTQVRNKTVHAFFKLALVAMGAGALLVACGGEQDGSQQSPAFAAATNGGSFDVSDPAGWAPIAASGSSVTMAHGAGHDATAPASLQINYQVAAGGYAALEHRFATPVDWSTASAVNLWIDGNGAGQTFVMQIYDSGSERWEARVPVTFTGWQQVTIPFGSLKAAAWQPAGATINGVHDFAGVKGVAVIPSEAPGNGTLFIDTLALGAGAPGPSAAKGLVASTGANGTIIPLYTYPTDASWDAVVAAKQAHPTVPVLAVINPSNGPGPSASASYTAGITKLTAAGVKVIGYVHTSWGGRSAAELQTEMQQYRTWYPGVTGIFFDEMANAAGHESYYSSLSANAKTAGFDVTIGNPGADTAQSYVGSVDVILIYENAGVPPVTEVAGWHAAHDRSNFGVIPYGVSSLDTAFVAAARPTVGSVYLQNATMPHPWSSVPPYLSDLLGALQ
ncbi:MAG TPA: CIA30 family protein [Polyangia bacterium]|nr:CIA30 family protein [Polyangia bacterium]